ncbi:carbonate dehydratase [Paraliobacillus quinghaiensis]|uniref:Carbonate dehydratase n=1 Tax=Paraliobacillus quinghaiensis TaxID=470815 RepID=A0A917TIG2_9BACI|nr:cation-transporting P-type ATPase [Paraliobacillus quinghaiensis]GGM24346.1 carbonate dehydratase [Paraliobacillus quinghaiensis]
MDDDAQKNWFAKNIDDLQKELKTDIELGLAEDEVKERLDEFGENKLDDIKKESTLKKIIKQFHDIIIYVLIAATIITFLIEHYIDSAVIGMVVIVNALIGYFQESKAQKALDSIRNMLSVEATVERDGSRVEIDAKQLVRGDVVYLFPGDRVPADIRIVDADNLKVEESALTGESDSVEKQVGALPDDTVLADRINMAFSGTSVTSGTGVGVVVETGNHTEIGKINEQMTEVKEMETPLTKQTAEFGKNITIAVVLIAIAFFVFAYFFRDYEIGELFLSVIAMVVGSIPEGLPAIMSMILAIGVQKMAKRNAIVKSLPSVETLGSVSIINSDKTGTLTKNEMTVKTVITPNQTYSITGEGYAPEGEIQSETKEKDPLLEKFLLATKTANESELFQDENGRWNITGEPTDGCFITLAEKTDLSLPETEEIDKIPFDSSYKYMATLASGEEGRMIYIKGAPGEIFDMLHGNNEFDRNFWEQQMEQMAKHGQRVIAVAYKKVSDQMEDLTHDDVKKDIEFLGLAGIIDPPREEAIQSVKAAQTAGVQVKMITGDHPSTAVAIGKKIGILKNDKAITGKEIDQMSDDELAEVIEDYAVFARTSPANKLRIVKALQKNGEVTSMTGDGVNDAPALKKADIGVAMGIKGTEVSKDASNMILTDDNFSTIVDAIEEGRRVYDNVKKTILFLLPTSAAEGFIVMASILLGISMPLSPVQLLWINMVTAVTISFAFVYEPAEKDVMVRKPREKGSQLLSKYYVFRIFYVAAIVAGTGLIVNTIMVDNGFDHAVANTVTLNIVVFGKMFYLFNVRNEHGFALNKSFFTNKVAFIVCGILIGLQLAITYAPFMHTVFATAPLEFGLWFIPIALGLVVFIVVEMEKYLNRRFFSKH